MKRFFLLPLTPFLLAATPPTVDSTTLVVDSISHASARLNYQFVAMTQAGWPTNGRVRYLAATSGHCSGGTGGTVDSSVWGKQSHSETLGWQYAIATSTLTLLTPATTYNVCPEVSNDNGATWSSGVETSFTTDPLPAVHPALPIAPKTFTTNYPDTTGYRVVSLPNNDDCSALQTTINNAISDPATNGAYAITGDTLAAHDQRTRGVLIYLTAGSTCIGKVRPTRLAPDVVTLSASAFNTTSSVITSPAHGLAEGDAITLAPTWYATSPGGCVCNNSTVPGMDVWHPTTKIDQPFSVYGGNKIFWSGFRFYVHVIDANSFQLYLYAPYGSSCNANHAANSDCPILWQFLSQGAGSIEYAPYPKARNYERNLQWIIVRTATSDSQFTPEHVRLSPLWQPKMAAIQTPNSLLGSTANQNKGFVSAGSVDSDGGYEQMMSHVRFLGIEWTYQPLGNVQYSNAPLPGQTLLSVGPNSDSIIFDRNYIHGYPPPFQTDRVFDLNGSNVAIIDSDVRDFHIPRPYNFGLAVH